jgi:hypothetical protein
MYQIKITRFRRFILKPRRAGGQSAENLHFGDIDMKTNAVPAGPVVVERFLPGSHALRRIHTAVAVVCVMMVKFVVNNGEGCSAADNSAVRAVVPMIARALGKKVRFDPSTINRPQGFSVESRVPFKHSK